MNLVGYTRVSTDVQTEGLGLDVQQDGCRRWAETHGHQVVLWTSDEGISGANGIDSRRGLLDALTALEDGAAEGLVVYKLDRLARALTVQEGTLARAWACGAAVYAVDIGEIAHDDPDDPMRTALRQMVGVFAQLERGMIAARLRAGRRLKADRGGFAYGSPPYGWRAEAGELVAVPEEQAALALIRRHRAQGATLRAIATALEAAGHRPKRAKRWHPDVIRRLIARPEGADGHTDRIVLPDR